MDPNSVKEIIEAGLKDSTVFIQSEDGVHFNAIVVSEQFSSKNRIERQKLVYATLGQHIANGTIHAISFKTMTEEEWRHSTSK